MVTGASKGADTVVSPCSGDRVSAIEARQAEKRGERKREEGRGKRNSREGEKQR